MSRIPDDKNDDKDEEDTEAAEAVDINESPTLLATLLATSSIGSIMYNAVLLVGLGSRPSLDFGEDDDDDTKGDDK